MLEYPKLLNEVLVEYVKRMEELKENHKDKLEVRKDSLGTVCFGFPRASSNLIAPGSSGIFGTNASNNPNVSTTIHNPIPSFFYQPSSKPGSGSGTFSFLNMN